VTGADFTGVDIDLLADYVGGALDGTPDASRVAALIAEDPAWRDAHALLRDGMTEVGDALSQWGAAPEPMPADVVARLAATLGTPGEATASGTPGEATASGTAASGSAGGAAGGRHLTAVRETGVDREVGRRPSIRRRALRWGAPTAVAATVLALAGVGIAYLGGETSSKSDSSASAGSAMSAQQAEGYASMPSATTITSTDLDYNPSILAAEAAEPFRAPAADGLSSAPVPPKARPTAPMVSDKSMADALARLRPADALQACLDAIGAENAAGPITVQAVDYARFSGQPALVVRFTAGNGKWAWASGPNCGLPSAGADKAYSVKVG
jgi:hypothetical protein